jgi:hypothetical protein
MSGAKVSDREEAFLINFVYGKNQILRVYKTNNQEDALIKARLFSDKLKARVFMAGQLKKNADQS